MRIRIQIQLLFKVMEICNHWIRIQLQKIMRIRIRNPGLTNNQPDDPTGSHTVLKMRNLG
jgi:hypothetical protein